MNVYLKIGGCLLIMLSALLVGREYSKYTDRRIAENAGFLSLVRHMEGQVAKFLSYGDGLFFGFEDSALESCGFLTAIKDGESLSSAMEKCKSHLSISPEMKSSLTEFFTHFGGDYQEEELRKISAFLSKIEKMAERDSENMTKNLQVARALLLGGALWASVMAL